MGGRGRSRGEYSYRFWRTSVFGGMEGFSIMSARKVSSMFICTCYQFMFSLRGCREGRYFNEMDVVRLQEE